MVTEYEVEAYKDGRWWVFEIPALTASAPTGGKGPIVAIGQTRNVRDLADEARSLAALWTQSDESDIEVHIRFKMPLDMEQSMIQAADLDAQGRAALDKAAAIRRKVVHELRTTQGMSQIESAHILGISRQRVQQLEVRA